MIDFSKSVSERFIRYTEYDTMSDPSLCGKKRPTTDGQRVLLEELKRELEELGVEAYLGPESVVIGTIKANVTGAPTIGFISHVDTADDVQGNGVKARVHHYQGGDILLEGGTVIRESENPELSLYIGSDIITSDGSTLLGADDKAGVAEIMEAVSYLMAHPEIAHGEVEVCFTPDEETGSGMSVFPYDRLRSSCCYTVDGGSEGEVECECFNAATLNVKIEGVSMHLGSARGKLVNALTVASTIASSLPQAESPEATDGRYGYYCFQNLSGTATSASFSILIRDFDGDLFDFRIKACEDLILSIAAIYHAKAEVERVISYRNMAEANAKVPKVLDAVFEGGRRIGLDLRTEIIRGGTDGARLAEKGIPCPNLFTGGHNFHSLEEWCAVSAMSKSVNLILSIISCFAEG